VSKPATAEISVCLITPYPPNRHGLSEFSQSLVRGFEETAKNRIRLQIVSFTSDGADAAQPIDRGAAIHRVLRSGSTNTLSALRSIIGLFRLVTLLAKLRPDIVHVQFEFTRYYGGTIGEPFIFTIALAKRILRFKLISTLQTVWSRHSLIQRLGEVVRVDLIAAVLSPIYASYYFALEGVLVRTCDIVVLPTLTLGLPILHELKARYRHNGGCRIVEIPHGVYQVSVPSKSRRTGLMTILSFGAIRKGKGQEALIETVHRLKVEYGKDVKLVIAGFVGTSDTGHLEELIGLVARYDLSRQVKIIPRFLEPEEIVRWHELADVVIINYSRMVGPSGALMWAIATETVPIMMTSEFWTPNVPGIVVHTQEEMMRALAQLAKNRLALRQIRDKIAGYRTTYSFNNVAKLHLQLYQSLCAGRRR